LIRVGADSRAGYFVKGDVLQMKRRSRLAFAACAVAAGLTLAACSSSSPSSSGGSTGGSSASGSNAAFNAGVTKVVNPSTKKGGTLTFGLSSTPDSFDAGNTYYAWTFDMTRLWATPLITYKSCPGACGNTLVPGIATSLGTVSDNGLMWTYHIKQGLKFEDGTPITAADVKYAIERTYDRAVLANGPNYFPNLLADPKYPGPYKDKTGNLTSITTPDQYTIQFHLVSPFADFDYVAALPQTAPVPQAKDTGSNYQLHPQSTGPYMFSSYQVNKQLTLVPNPNWTPNMDPQASQLADKVVVNLNVNAQDLDNRLQAGDIDIDAQGIGVSAATRAKILSNPSLEKNADASPGNREWFTYINTKVAPLNNLACRQAVEYAANKTDLQTAWGGPYAGGQIATTLLLPGMGGYSSFDLYNAKSQPTGDLTAAKAALQKCGHPTGFTVGASYRSDRPAETAAVQALQQALGRVGINLQLHGYTSGSYYTNFAGSPNYVHQHNIGIAMGGWSPDWPDGYGMMDELVNGNTIVPTGNTNIGELNDPAINNLFSQASNATLEQRNTIYGQIDHLAMAQAVILPNVYATNLLYRNPAVTNVYTMTPFGMYNYAVMGVSS
jgi:peptide/nickel transport system substrate-binding protein